jgi:hypothetical protein
MKIGILSDTHNDKAITRRALQAFRQRGVYTLFHCGDLVFAEIVRLFNEFEVYFVSGNMDRNYRQAIKMEIDKLPGARWLGVGDEVELVASAWRSLTGPGLRSWRCCFGPSRIISFMATRTAAATSALAPRASSTPAL